MQQHLRQLQRQLVQLQPEDPAPVPLNGAAGLCFKPATGDVPHHDEVGQLPDPLATVFVQDSTFLQFQLKPLFTSELIVLQSNLNVDQICAWLITVLAQPGSKRFVTFDVLRLFKNLFL